MGAWGIGSDENDWTYDAVGFGIGERMMGVSLTENGRTEIVKDLLDMDGTVMENVGVVILLLKLGCTLPKEALVAARVALVGELDNGANTDNVQARKVRVAEEIQMIDSALGNNGSVPGPPIGLCGIASAMGSGH